MSRSVYWTAAVLFFIGGATFLYKNQILDMPVQPDRSARVWRVEMAVNVRGEGQSGRIEVRIPSSDDDQVLLDEHSFDDGLAFTTIASDGERRASWRGVVGEAHRLSYSFRVHVPLKSSRAASLPIVEEISNPEDALEPAHPHLVAPSIARQLEKMGIAADDDSDATIASLFGFVAHDIENVIGASEDARIVLHAREGSQIGQCRLLIELLMAAGVEARLGSGIPLRDGGRSEVTYFVEAQTHGTWLRLLPTSESPGDFPSKFVVLSYGDRSILSSAGVAASQVDITVMRESLPPAELASFVSPASPFWRAISLYRLPIETQGTLKILLVVPVAVLVAAIGRNLVGLPTFGVFMPILIALSLRRTDLVSGLVLVSSVLMAGVIGRLALDRLRLLFVPRICVLLCLVIIFITGLAQIGYQFNGRGLMSGLLFPIVILAMLIERISVTTLEEGLGSTSKLLSGSLLLSSLSYPVFQSELLTFLFFGFPELILCVMAFLILIGGYSGYRLAELWRFRSFVPREARSLP